MTYNELFKQISENTGIEYKHYSVEGRIKDICDFYGVSTTGKLLTEALKELLQIKECDCKLYGYFLQLICETSNGQWKDVIIDDNPEIINTINGNLKINRIRGKSTQVQETGIVPTPERHIPIISKKIKVNDELVELRSLKETGNLLFDDSFGWSKGYVEGNTGLITNGSTINNEVCSDFQPIKPNTSYGMLIETSLEGSTDNLQWCGVGLYDENKSFIKRETISQTNSLKASKLFTTPSNAKYFRFSFRKYTDGVAMLTETSKLPTTYIRPTVRDYKIVDHVNKISKIVRNVKPLDLSTLSYQVQIITDDKPYFVANYVYSTLPAGKKGTFIYCFADKVKVYQYNGFQTQMEDGFCVSEYGIMHVVNGIKTKEEYDEWIKKNPINILYALNTPTEETIPYLETDSSDYGVSYQDTTTPSPTIPSEVTSIENIDLKICGKQLWDNESAMQMEFWNTDLGAYWYKKLDLKSNTTYTISMDKNNMHKDYKSEYNGLFALYIGENKGTFKNNNLIGNSNSKIVPTSYTFTTSDKPYYMNLYTFEKNSGLEIAFTELLQNIMLVEGATSQPYEPYKEQHIQLTPPQQFYSILNESIADEVDVVSGVYRYNLKKTIFNLDDVTNVSKINTTSSGFNNFTFKFKNAIVSDRKINTAIECSSFKGIIGARYTDKAYVISGDNVTKDILYFNVPSEIKTVDQAKELLKNDMELIYVLETPTEIPIPQETLEQLRKLKTYSPITSFWFKDEPHAIIEASVKTEMYDRKRVI